MLDQAAYSYRRGVAVMNSAASGIGRDNEMSGQSLKRRLYNDGFALIGGAFKERDLEMVIRDIIGVFHRRAATIGLKGELSG